MNYYFEAFRKYAVFKGRASRPEYWYFFLINFIVSVGIDLLVHIGLSGQLVFELSIIYSVAVFLPSTAVFVRRLHDTNRSGWWWFLGLVPIVGAIILLVWLAGRGDRHDNRYGPKPYTPAGGALPDLRS